MKNSRSDEFEMTLDAFEKLILEDTDMSDIRTGRMTLLRTIFSEIRPHVSALRANTPDLAQMAGGFSPTFSGLDACEQQFVTGILTIPVIFFCSPEDRLADDAWS